MLESSNSILRVKLHTALIIEALKKKARGATELAGVKKKNKSQRYLLLILLTASWETIVQKSYTLPWEDFLKAKGRGEREIWYLNTICDYENFPFVYI